MLKMVLFAVLKQNPCDILFLINFERGVDIIVLIKYNENIKKLSMEGYYEQESY